MKKLNVGKHILLGVLMISLSLQSVKSVQAANDDRQNECMESELVSGEFVGDKSVTGEPLLDSSPIVEINQDNVKEFVDAYFQKNMEKFKVPGAAVSVVKNGEELYKAGYGVSDWETQEPVDPELTTFPAASVSKLFTATAIMQLYQNGSLDLNEDIEKYVDDIKINNPFSGAITCQNLLTHSSGLDEASELCGGTLNKDSIKSPKEYFMDHEPNVVIQPDTVSRYSNMGYNLLGYIIEKVSRESYEDYITENILVPLQMDHSSVRMENGTMASGHEYVGGTFQKAKFAYQYASGSSGVIATVTDMENFMIMHLNNGTYEDREIISAQTESMMQEKQFSNSNFFDGMGEGFIRDNWNGVQIIKHEGALPGYTTTLFMIPEENFGIYVATNSLGGMVFDFEEAFMKYFYGDLKVEMVETVQSYDMDQYVGNYRSYDGIAEDSNSKIFALIDSMSEFTVKKVDSNTLELTYYDQQKEKVVTELVYQGDHVFARGDGKGYIAFRTDEHEKITYAFHNVSHQTYVKTGFLQTSGFISMELIILLLILFMSSIIFLIRQKKYRTKENLLFRVTCSVIGLIYVISFIVIFLLSAYMILNYDYTFIFIIYFILSLLLITIIVNIIWVVAFCYQLAKKRFGILATLKYSVISVVQILFILMLYSFNMIGFHVL